MVGSKLVASMARPGGNTTGISILASELDVKRLQLLNELVPQFKKIGILADPTTIATGPQLTTAARALDLELVTVQAADADAVARGIDQLINAITGALIRHDATNLQASERRLDARAGRIMQVSRQIVDSGQRHDSLRSRRVVCSFG